MGAAAYPVRSIGKQPEVIDGRVPGGTPVGIDIDDLARAVRPEYGSAPAVREHHVEPVALAALEDRPQSCADLAQRSARSLGVAVFGEPLLNTAGVVEQVPRRAAVDPRGVHEIEGEGFTAQRSLDHTATLPSQELLTG